MLEEIKALTDITDDSKDTLLNYLIEKAVLIISNYLREDKLAVKDSYKIAIIELVLNAYNYQKSENSKGIKSMSQGQRSITFEESFKVAFNDDVRALLPLPKVRLL